MSSLSGKSVIVTGSSSGIGLGTAVLFATKGSNVTVCGRDAGRCQEAVKACEDAAKAAGVQGKYISVVGDISETVVIQKTIDDTMKAFGSLDVLVMNHGANMLKGNESIETWTQECFDFCMKVNVRSMLEMTQYAVPHLEKTKGNIVCVSSLGSIGAINQVLNYLIAKAALNHAVRCLALQLGPKGIRVNATLPTYVESRLLREAAPEQLGFVEIMGKLFVRETPLQGVPSGPEEQAEVIAFLASDAARLVHGQCICVDGGLGIKGQPTNFPALFAEFMPAQ